MAKTPMRRPTIKRGEPPPPPSRNALPRRAHAQHNLPSHRKATEEGGKPEKHKLPSFKEGVYYDVQLTESIRHGSMWMRPHHAVRMVGEVATKYAKSIYSAQESHDQGVDIVEYRKLKGMEG